MKKNSNPISDRAVAFLAAVEMKKMNVEKILIVVALESKQQYRDAQL